MFLSMLESYVDAVWTDAPFPSEKQPLPSYLVHAEPARGSLLVLHLDLADLHVAGDTSEAVLRVACRDLLTAAATTCYRAYRHLLHDKGDDTCLDKVTLQRLLVRSRQIEPFPSLNPHLADTSGQEEQRTLRWYR